MDEYRILLHDSQEENDRLWCMYERLRLKYEALEDDYNELACDMCEAEAERDEARSVAGELFNYVRADVGQRCGEIIAGYKRIRPSVRRMLEE